MPALHRIRERPARHGPSSAAWLALTLTQTGSRFASWRFRPRWRSAGQPRAAVPTQPWTGQSPVTTRATTTRAVPTRVFETNYTISSESALRSGPVPELVKEGHHVSE